MARVIGGAECHLARRFVGQLRFLLAGKRVGEVHVHVHEARSEPHAVRSNYFRVRGNSRAPRRAYGGDALALDDHDGVSNRPSAVEIDYARANDRLHLSLRGLRCQTDQGGGQQQIQHVSELQFLTFPEARPAVTISLRYTLPPFITN